MSLKRLAALFLISFALPNWAMNELNINLMPLEGDAEKFALPLSIAIKSKTIKGMIDDLGDLETLSEEIRAQGIPVQVDARNLKVIAVCLENLKKLENIKKEQNSNNLIELIKNSFVEAETKEFSLVTETKQYSLFDSFISLANLANSYLFATETIPYSTEDISAEEKKPYSAEDISVEDIIKFILAAHFLDIDKKLFPPAAAFLVNTLKGTTLAQWPQAGKKLENILKEHNIPQELFVYFKDYISWFENSLYQTKQVGEYQFQYFIYGTKLYINNGYDNYIWEIDILTLREECNNSKDHSLASFLCNDGIKLLIKFDKIADISIMWKSFISLRDAETGEAIKWRSYLSSKKVCTLFIEDACLGITRWREMDEAGVAQVRSAWALYTPYLL